MKLPLLLTTLLLAASPVVADDFLYLKCTGTVQWGEIKPSGEKSQVTVPITLHFKIDTKEKFYIDSVMPENQHEMKIRNGVLFEQFTDFQEPLTGITNVQIAFDPPGMMLAKTKARNNSTSVEITQEISGSCEASDAETYESSKQ